MSCVGMNNIKEEPEWEDYCISEAQAREAAQGGLAVKLEPGAEPPGSFAVATDKNYKSDGSIQSQSNSIKSHDTEQNSNGSVTVKEEVGEKSWLQEVIGLYEETNNTNEPKTPLDLYSEISEEIETDAECEELNKVPSVFQKPKIVNSREDLVVINNIAQEVNRKRVIAQEKISRPVTKYVYTPNQQPVMPVKNNSQFKKPYVFNKVTINPDIGLLSQPLKVANALLKNNLVSVKKQSSNFASQGYSQKIPLLNSVAYNNPAVPRAMVPMPCPPRRATESLKQPLPTGIFRPIQVPVPQLLSKSIFQPIKIPISQLKGNVSLKPLKKNPPKTTTSIPKLRPVIISKLQSNTSSELQPDNTPKLQPDTISKLQHGAISELPSDTISKVQYVTITKLQPRTISKLQPDTNSKLQPSTIPTLKTNVRDLQTGPPSFIPIVGNPFENVKPIYQEVPYGNNIEKPSKTSALKSNITATPSSKPMPIMPTNFQRIKNSKSINSQITEAFANSLTPKIINGDKQSATLNNSNIQRIAALAPRAFPKPLNSQIAKPIHNHIPQTEHGYRKAEVTQNCNVQRMEPKTVPKVSGPVNSLISKSSDNDIIPGCINDDRQAVTPKLPPNSNRASEKSDKVVNLEDFLKPSYVVLERMKKRTCKDCEKTFYEHKAFIDHMNTRQIWKKTISNLRNDGGTRKDTTKIDSSLPSLTCKYCQKLFSKPSVLYIHISRNHLCRIRKFHCDYCGKKCLERRHLVNHIRTHTGEKPFKCLICKTRYRTASNLASHNINMHGTKKHFCPICNKPFNMVSNMNRHIRTHSESGSGERRYVCDICNKRFIQKHHLARHMESHLGIRRYTCNNCKMRFLRKAHLDRHKKNIHKKKRLLKSSRQKV